MTAPMTPREAEIRKQLADAPGSFGNPAVVRDLLAEIDRLRALPVVQTCSRCPAVRYDDDGRAECQSFLSSVGWRKVVANAAPPPWCPLRGARP